MSRIFLSHASAETIQALALKKWLIDQNPPLANDIFLDVDDIKPTDEWAQVIQERGENCRVMVCLVSKAWEESWECRQELKIARRFNKGILPARLGASVGQTVENYQWVDLYGEGRQTEIEVEYQEKEHVVSFPSRALRRLRDAVVGHGIGADTFVWPPPSDLKRVPYRGWAAHDEFDAAVFFGRDAQIARALKRMHEMRVSDEEETLFVILGPSGAGKSSFLRAGLLPRLRRDDANYIVLDIVRPEDNVLTGPNGLANAIHAACETYGLPPIALGDVRNACLEHTDEVGRLLREIHEAATAQLDELPEDAIKPSLVIPLDQAEELFGVDAGREAGRFLDLIGEYTKAEFAEQVPLIVAVTVRTEHHGKLQNAPQLNAVRAVLFDDLKPLPMASFKEVIEGPARRATEGGRPLELEHELVEKLLIDGTQGADTLPLLSLTLARLYESYGEDGLLELDEYKKMGEMRNVVQAEIEALLSNEAAERLRQLEMLRAAFVPGLATINPDTDLPVRRVAQWNKVNADVKPLLEKFIDKRLLVKDSRDGGDVVEVALEGLLIHWTDLKGWLDAQREDLKRAELLNREAAAWQKNERNTAYLLEGRRLEDAEKLFKRPDYRPHIAAAREFVTASRTRARRRRLILQGAAAIIVVAALVAGFFEIRAVQSSRQTTAWRLLNEASQMLEGSRAGGDVRALQELLAARSIGKDAAGAVEAVAEGTRGQDKIIQNPPRTDRTSDGKPIEGIAPVRSVAMSPDGTRIAWANDDKLVRVWDQQTNDIRGLETFGDFASKAVAFSPDGKLLAAGTGDSRLLLWDANELTPVVKPIRHSQGVLSVGFSGDGKWIATGASDGTIRVFDTAGNLRFRDPARHQPSTQATGVALSSDGRFLVSGGDDATVRLWDAQSGRQLQQAGDPEVDNAVMAVAFSRKDDLVAVGRRDGILELRDGRTLALRLSVKAHPNAIESLAFGPNGSRIVTGGGDNTVRVWDVDTLTPVGSPLLGHHGQVSSVRFSGDGARIVSGGFDGSVRVWNALTAVPILAKQGKDVRAAAFSPDGHQFASGGTDGTVKIWDAAKGKYLSTIGLTGPDCDEEYKCSVIALAFDPKRPRLVTGAADGTVRVWDLTDPRRGRLLRINTPPEVPPDASKVIKSVAFSPDGDMIAAAGLDGVVRVWDANTDDLTPIAAEIAHGKRPPSASADEGADVRYEVWSLAFSPDGRHMATGSGYDENGTDSNFLQLWTVDPNRDDPLMRDGDPIVDHQGWVIYCVDFDREGKRVVTSSYDGTIRVFDSQSHNRIALLSSDRNPVLSVAFAHHEDLLVAGGTDGKVRLWDTKTYEPVGTPLVGHSGWVYAVAFSPHDDVILSASADGTIRLWSAPTDFTIAVCGKLVANMSEKQWEDWVSDGDWTMRYRKLCDLPISE
jgi:WD40 repeat protein